MTTEQLNEFITEMVTFLETLDKVIPGKVDEELIGFLKSVQDHPWTVDLILASMTPKKGIKG